MLRRAVLQAERLVLRNQGHELLSNDLAKLKHVWENSRQDVHQAHSQHVMTSYF